MISKKKGGCFDLSFGAVFSLCSKTSTPGTAVPRWGAAHWLFVSFLLAFFGQFSRFARKHLRPERLSLAGAPFIGYSLAFCLPFLDSFLALLENIRSGQQSLTQAPLVMLAAYALWKV
ncbi:MAG: hypothetical protein IJH61_01290 [Eubacteriaceae bacterium]|nr:hypothetical protein [Eubacteriaceae bacterium]